MSNALERILVHVAWELHSQADHRVPWVNPKNL